ncbi:MAG: very short patch repair endonuclease [Citrobacter freundii]|nr:MAG: very short patch repair endonuclease [Citrobacter freundii]
MADVHSKEKRSFNMSRIRAKNTKPEMVVRKFLFSQGLRYRLHDKRFPGKPDLVFPKYKTAVFINGCFWHGHEGCRFFVIPKTRTEWWMAKINRNREKDITSKELIQNTGWKVIVLWECDLKSKQKETVLDNLIKEIKANR